MVCLSRPNGSSRCETSSATPQSSAGYFGRPFPAFRVAETLTRLSSIALAALRAALRSAEVAPEAGLCSCSRSSARCAGAAPAHRAPSPSHHLPRMIHCKRTHSFLTGSVISGPSETSASIPSPKMGGFWHRSSQHIPRDAQQPTRLPSHIPIHAWPSWKSTTVCMGLRSKLPSGADY